MLYQIQDGTVSIGGREILSHIEFEIKGNEKIAIVGRNGAGKTTLLRLIGGELSLDRDDKRRGAGISSSRRLHIGMLGQQTAEIPDRTVEEELLLSRPAGELYSRERFEYEQEYDRIFTGLGFAKADKKKKLNCFSGGEQTKIALIRLLLEKPDILLLDEPTNHLDMETAGWLERYLQTYPGAVVMVSHDRFFLDRTAQFVYELEGGRLRRYAGNYTAYRQEKRKELERQRKAYERQQEELARLDQLVERFKHKPNKASFARAKRRQKERMELTEAPRKDDVHLFTGDIVPEVPGGKWVFEAEHLKLGYDRPLLELTMKIRRGQKIGLLGPNGAGKSTFLKTVAGFVQPISGKMTLGNRITIGYFDQHSARLESEKTVLEHFHDLFPSMTEKEVRSVLGGYLFDGRACASRVSSLSGGEKSRLVLAELLQSRPNFLILDEPTNHMDIQARETLESAFQAYRGTILFVSHDRYFIRQVAESVLIFEKQSAMYYPFGYEHYLERKEREGGQESVAAQIRAEDQALIAGLQAVPKAERHRLREISTEEAYRDWMLRLAAERMEEARETWRLAAEEEEAELMRRQEEELERWGTGEMGAEVDNTPAGPESGRLSSGETWRQWHERCLEWWEIWADVPEKSLSSTARL